MRLLFAWNFAGGAAAGFGITPEAFEVGSQFNSRLVTNARVFLTLLGRLHLADSNRRLCFGIMLAPARFV